MQALRVKLPVKQHHCNTVHVHASLACMRMQVVLWMAVLWHSKCAPLLYHALVDSSGNGPASAYVMYAPAMALWPGESTHMAFAGRLLPCCTWSHVHYLPHALYWGSCTNTWAAGSWVFVCTVASVVLLSAIHVP